MTATRYLYMDILYIPNSMWYRFILKFRVHFPAHSEGSDAQLALLRHIGLLFSFRKVSSARLIGGYFVVSRFTYYRLNAIVFIIPWIKYFICRTSLCLTVSSLPDIFAPSIRVQFYRYFLQSIYRYIEQLNTSKNTILITDITILFRRHC